MTNEFSFMEIEKVEVEILPTLVKKDIYLNQSKSFDMVNIKKQTGLIIGVGSVGSNCVYTMNKFGFSSFVVYDFDVWEAHNSASSIYDYYTSLRQSDRSKGIYQNWTYYPNYQIGRADPEFSSFKVDLLREVLQRSDKQLNFERFRVPFGEGYEDSMKAFLSSIIKMEAVPQYDINGKSTGRTRLHSEPIEIDLLSNTKPNYMLITIDNLKGRLKAVNMIKKLLMNVYMCTDTFPIIDARTLDTVKGELYLFDVFNDNDYLKWINTMIPPKEHFETLKDFEFMVNEKEENWDLIKVLDLDIANVCGEKMSILISQQMAISVTNLLANIFREKDVINLDRLPKETYINTSMFQPYYAPSKEFTDI